MATVAAGDRARPNSPSVVVRGPPLAPPTSVYLHAEAGRVLRVSWARNGSAADPGLSYKVIFTPEESLAQGCATRYRTRHIFVVEVLTQLLRLCAMCITESADFGLLVPLLCF
jgi:hypothetical protein